MNIDNYLRDIKPFRKERLLAMIDKVKALYPDATPSMDYKMPTFKTDNGWVAVANQKNYVSFYTCSAEHLTQFKHQYPSIKTGKGCINFSDTDDIDLVALESVIHSAFNH